MIGRGGAAAAILSCAVGAAPAHAWEYARWGMTPAELVAASDGAAKLMAAPAPRRDGKLVAKVEADARYDSVTVNAEFRFDPATDRLVEFGLHAEDSARCAALSEGLRARFGEPPSTARFGQISSSRWHDSTRAARVIFLAVVLSSSVRCSIVYSEAARAG